MSGIVKGPEDGAEAKELDAEVEQARQGFAAALKKKWRVTKKEPIPGATYLRDDVLIGAEMFARRESVLPKLSGCRRIMEIGTWEGTFARSLISAIAPSELHIVDIDFSRFDREYFKSVNGSRIILHEGSSFDILPSFADNYFDFIYIDGDHSYSGAKQDLINSFAKVNVGGLIGVNDYTTWCACLGMEFGVMRAVNEIILNHPVIVKYFAFHHNGNHDIFLQKMQSTA
jgi:predicted O-methyltransferase YrrM